MSHEHTQFADEICAKIPILCRAIDAIECRAAYDGKEDDIRETTKILCHEAFGCLLYSLTPKQVSTYLVDHGGIRWSDKRFRVSKDGWNVTLVSRK